MTQVTVVLQPAEVASIDTQIYSGAPTFNYGIRTGIIIGNLSGQLYRGLIKFDLSSIPVGAVVLSATMGLRQANQGFTTPQNAYFHRSLVQWYEGEKDSAAPDASQDGSTWNLRNANGSVAWVGGAGGAAGSDYATVPTGVATVTGAGDYTWDMTPDVAAFVDGSLTNHGWWGIINEGVNNTWKQYYSGNSATPANHPFLSVTYFMPEENDGALLLQTDVEDTYINNGNANSNDGGKDELRVGMSSGSITHRGLIKFDVSSLPAGAQVYSGILSLYVLSEQNTFDLIISLRRALLQWYEGNEIDAAPGAGEDGSVWNFRNFNGSVAWGAAGGLAGTDYVLSASETDDAAVTGAGIWIDFDVTADLIGFIDASFTNHGWWLIPETLSVSQQKTFASSEYAVTSLRPKLTLLYTFEADVEPEAASAVGATAAPTILSGTTLNTVPAAEAVGETADENANIGGETILGVAASAVGETALSGVSFTLRATASAVGATSGPSATIKGGIALTPTAASAVGDTGGLASLVDLALRPAAASARGLTLGRVVALRIYPIICDPRPYLYITDGSVKDNGQQNILSLIDPKNGFVLNNWLPNISQYKGGGTFSDSPLASGRRLARRVFGNGIEVFDLKLRGHDQDKLIQFLRDLFAWQELAADYWESDWGDRPVYIAAKAAKETNMRYAVIHTMSVPELTNPYAQPFFSQTGKPTLEAVSLRIERGEWCDTPPGEGGCVPVSGVRSWTVTGWTEGETGGGGDATITGDILSLIQASNGDILAGTDDQAQIYRSTDSGATWILLYKIGSGTDRVNAIAKDSSGYLYAAVTGSASAQGLWKSTNHGVSWTRVKTHPTGAGYNDVAFIQNNSTIVAVSNATPSTSSPVIVGSLNNTVWLEPSISHYYYNVKSVASFDSPGLITQYPGIPNGPEAFFGTDSYYTIAGRAGKTSSVSAFAIETASGQMGNGGLDMAAFGFRQPNGTWARRALWAVKSAADVTDTEIWQWPNPANGTDTFGKIATIDNKLFNVLYVDPTPDSNSPATQRTIWAGANGEIYVSYNSGLTWSLATAAPVNQIRSFVRTTSGTLIAGGENGEIFIFSGDTSTPGGGIGGGSVGGGSVVVNTYPLGMEETCEDEVYVANKSSFTNITNVFHYNGSTYSDLQFGSQPPYEILGTNPTVNKAVYFGSKTGDSNVPGGTFSGVVFDITQIAEDITVVWEYWNGATWTTLTVQDSSNGFRTLGVGSVHWILPVNWATTSVNSVTGYWVRARISALGASPVYPIHDNRYIYTPNLPYVEIAENAVDGDLPAKAQIRWHNRSDDPASAIDLEVDRLVLGLRSVERGRFFNAFLNISDVQIPYGFTLSTHADGTWGDALRSPTNRALSVSHASGGSLNTWNDLVSFSIANTVAKDYYGTYRAFVRCYKYGAGSNNWQIRIRTSFGSGGSKSDTKSAFPTTSAEWEVLDLGQISIPTTQVSLNSNNLGDQLKLTVQGYATATGVGITLYDLILIPVDEWATDVRSPELSTANTAKVQGGSYLDVDSITNPKALMSASNRNSADLIVSRYLAITNGPAILQTGRQQRVWTLAMSYENFWRAAPEIVGTIQIFKQQRYLGFRGQT